jgi:hypothetical protein
MSKGGIKMLVCAHGNVSEYCKNRDMIVMDTHEGNIEEYDGKCCVLVTDAELPKHEYYYLKGRLFARGVELVSTQHKDSVEVSDYVLYDAQKRRRKYGGRYRFGLGADGMLYADGKDVLRRIFELRDKGYSYRKIQDDPGVHHPDGRKICISTIQIIIQHRQLYEEKGLWG